MKVEFLSLKKINEEINEEIHNAINKVISSGWYILGESGLCFEKSMANYLSCENSGHVIGCNSGTDALVLSLRASEVRRGDEVITVANTAIPTVSAICCLGAVPVFVDIDPNTWLMDITKISNVITVKTKAIIPVHLYGNMVDIIKLKNTLKAIGREDIAIIEDVAQAHGAKLSGLKAGTLGDFGAYSFYPSKNIGALGDGGAIFCKNNEAAEKLKMLRNYGQKSRYDAEITGGLNSRLDEVQAAILDIKLKYLDEWNIRKNKIMENYTKEMASLPITFQKVTDNCNPGWHLCVIAMENRAMKDDLMGYLKDREIGTLIHYPIPAHKQKAFISYNSGDLPFTESLCERILSIPMNICLNELEQQFVISSIQSFFNSKV